MDKIATMVKEAEVRGVLAALVDAGHIKLASMEDLEPLTAAVSEKLADENYDLDMVLDKTAEVFEELTAEDSEEAMDKEAAEAEEVDETALMAAFGELTLMKLAGDIDDEAFEKEASRLAAIKDAANAGLAAARGLASKGGSAAKGAASKAGAAVKGLPASAKSLGRDLRGKNTNTGGTAFNAAAAAGEKARTKGKQLAAAKKVGTGAALVGSGAAGALYAKHRKGKAE